MKACAALLVALVAIPLLGGTLDQYATSLLSKIGGDLLLPIN